MPPEPFDLLASRIVVLAHTKRWLQGPAGRFIEDQFHAELAGLAGLQFQWRADGVVVQAHLDAWDLLREVLRVVELVESALVEQYPVLCQHLGGFWNRRLLSEFNGPPTQAGAG